MPLSYRELRNSVASGAHASASVVPLRRQPPAQHASAKRAIDALLGGSPALRATIKLIERFAVIDDQVLILGETGTGKELAARAVHEGSARAEGPFLAINCAALPENLIASELFGYERGAFTGADRCKPGLIELADGGTLFLDEVGDLPPPLQGHLLRFLQEREVFRLGARRPISVDTRVVAATHVDLRDAIAAGKFREDLFYRLNVLVIGMPPLRDRDGDIELLAETFLRSFAADAEASFTPAARAALRAHAWHGNVRELMSTVRRATVMADSLLITADHLALPATTRAAEPAVAQPRLPITAGCLIEVLERCGQNRTKAARELGISRNTLYRALSRARQVGESDPDQPAGHGKFT